MRVALLFTFALATPALAQNPPPDVLAARLVEAGREASAANDSPAAKAKFETVLKKYGNTPSANAARYGLAVLLSSGDAPDNAKAAELLKPAAHDGGFADRARAAQLAGVCELRLAAKEKEPRGRTERARDLFRTARDAARDKKDAEFAALASCDLADAELRLKQNQEARGTTEPFAKGGGVARDALRAHAGCSCTGWHNSG